MKQNFAFALLPQYNLSPRQVPVHCCNHPYSSPPCSCAAQLIRAWLGWAGLG